MSPVDGGHTRSKGKKPRQNGAPDVYAQILRRIHATHIIDKDDIIQLYHIEKPLCQGCRSNCKDSPNCFCGLVPPPTGARKQGLWQKVSDTIEELGPDPSESLRPSQDSPSGLTNLGATCYVNSVLQCLYMNTAFRKGVFAAEVDLVKQQPVLYQLSRIFAQLHSGKKVAVDSAPFANTLELDNAVQQDGQEFLKLLLTLLERVLGLSGNPQARNVVQNVFRGTFSYVTKCCKCGQESEASKDAVDFYELELNVKGFSTLDDSLNDYLMEENLQGENQYMCESCKVRVDATHSTKLRSLPPVLNFQLKRFVFNAKTATKKKVTSKFSFPRSLDMGPRLSSQSMADGERHPQVYDLSAILVHKGSMANSGHYVAHIKDDRTGQWWQFDDEQVTSLGFHPLGDALPPTVLSKDQSQKDGDNVMRQVDTSGDSAPEGQLLLGSGDIPSSAEASPKSSSFRHDLDLLTSADAYMLTYSYRKVSDSCPDLGSVATDLSEYIEIDGDRVSQELGLSLPDQFKSEVEDMNRVFETMCWEYNRRKEEELLKITDRRREVRTILAEAPVKKLDDPFFWISSDWLRNWADSLKPLPTIDNTPLLCQHQKTPPKKLSLMKRVSQGAWTELILKYKGGPLLSGSDHCVDCIFEDAKVAASADSYRDQRAYMRELVDDVLNGRAKLEGKLFYVSRTWLLQWVRRKAADAPSEADAGPTAALRCPHGGLLPEQAHGAKRQVVPESAWDYFYQTAAQVEGADPRGHSPFREDTEACAICQSEIDKVASKREGLRATKLEQRLKHEVLYAGRSVFISPGITYYLVPSVWLTRWRSYLGASGKNVLAVDEPDGLDAFILSLLCPKHESMLFKPPTLCRTRRGELTQRSCSEDVFTIVAEDDWMGLCHQWDVDYKKGIKAFIEPALDINCSKGVRRAIGEEDATSLDTCNGGLLDATMEESDNVPTQLDDMECKSEVAPVLLTVPGVCKDCIEERESHELMNKLHYASGEISVDLVRGKGPPPSLLAAGVGLEAERRTSKRARRASATSGGRVLLRVSGETTVFQLKLQIWESLAIVKENQRLHFGKSELVDDSATLADLNILPGAQLWVMDTGQHENRDIAEELPVADLGRTETEEGFRGTRLLMGLSCFAESISPRSGAIPSYSKVSNGCETAEKMDTNSNNSSEEDMQDRNCKGPPVREEQADAGESACDAEDDEMDEVRDGEGNLPAMKFMENEGRQILLSLDGSAALLKSVLNGVDSSIDHNIEGDGQPSSPTVNKGTTFRESTNCHEVRDLKPTPEVGIVTQGDCVGDASCPNALLQLKQTYDVDMDERPEEDPRPVERTVRSYYGSREEIQL